MLTVRAPAKLNLYLRILGRRPDGYHELDTVFERIDLADELTLEPQAGALTLTCDDPSLPLDETNLVLRAARVLQQASRSRRGARLHLAKRIPIAAGLGGGSSDAAATLSGLNEVWELGLTREVLSELAVELGSDVPFFLSCSAFAIGRGRGERCEALSDGPTLTQVLVTPEARLSTRAIYEDFARQPAASSTLTASGTSSTMLVHALRNGSLSELAKGFRNDLQPLAIRRCPVSSVIQRRLRELHCLGTLVSGSGPSVFGLCSDLAHGQEVVKLLRTEPGAAWRVEIVRTLHETSPRETRETQSSLSDH